MMSSELVLVLIGWILGVLTSFGIALFQFWLDGRRELRNQRSIQRRDDIRMARNWAAEGRKHSLRGFDLCGANLSGKDLASADLEDPDLEGATLDATNLSSANLRKVNFRRTNIYKTDFRNAKMWATDFTDASIGLADFSGADLEDAMFTGAKRLVDCKWDAVQINEATKLPAALATEISRTLAANHPIRSEDGAP